MVDIYSAIVGEPPTEREKLDALAKKLRGRSMVGQLGMLTGDKVLAPMGAGIGKEVEEQAGTIGGYQARRRELTAQEAMRAASALERAKQAELDRAHDEAMLNRRQAFDANQNALGRALDKELAKLKDSGKDYKTIPAKQFESMVDETQQSYDIGATIGGFKPEYATRGAPGTRALTNTAVSMGMPVGKENEDAAAWWADYERLYTLPTRNKLFGSALTAPERAAWKENAISPSMTPEVIQQRLKKFDDMRTKALNRKQESLSSAGYDPDQVGAIFQNPYNASGSAPKPAGPSKNPDDYATYEEYVQATGGG
jgi:hypothetical protein